MNLYLSAYAIQIFFAVDVCRELCESLCSGKYPERYDSDGWRQSEKLFGGGSPFFSRIGKRYGRSESDVQLPEYPDSGKINIPLSGSVHVPPYFINRSPMFYGDYSTSGQIAPGFYGSGSQTTLPGFGRMNQAAFGYQYALTDYLEVQAGVSATALSFKLR